jgi:sarcosine oxidase gamma subunit
MSKRNDRYVVKHPDGWAVRGPNSERASSIHRTQAQAENRAKSIVSDLGGGEVRIQGRNGRWRDSDTVAPGNDPNPPRDKKH